MKKMKGAAAAAPVDSSSPYVSVYEDPRARLRFHNLLQDYEDLYKVTAFLVKGHVFWIIFGFLSC